MSCPLVPLVVWVSCLLLPISCRAAEYEQKQGNAAVRFDADKVNEAGRVEIRLSDEIHVTISVEDRIGLEVQPMQFLTTSSDWQVRQESPPEIIAVAGDRVRWLQKFGLSPLRPGELSIVLAPLRFRTNNDEERWKEAAWRPIAVHVTTEIYRADLSELRDVMPPEEVPPAPSWEVPLIWTGLTIVLLLLFLSGWVWLRRRLRRDFALPPSAWALRELARIPVPDGSTDHGVECFYTRLSDVLRTYIELRYHLPAPEQTTAEFLEMMRRSPELQPGQQTTLREFLERSDLVKFARAQPSAEDCRMAAEIGQPLKSLRVDGGMARNAWFLQCQADCLGLPVLQAAQSESTALGSAFLAGLHAGIWPDLDSLRRLSQESRRFEPRWPQEERRRRLAEWRRAVQAVIAFYTAV